MCHIPIDDMSDGDAPTSPLSNDGMVRPQKVRPGTLDLLQQIQSSDDNVSRRVAQAACGHLGVRPCRRRRGRLGLGGVDALRICTVDSMAAESHSVGSDEGAISVDSDPCETD
jgi:hypothetical protein